MSLRITEFGLYPNKCRWGEKEKYTVPGEDQIELCLEWLGEYTYRSGRWTHGTSYGYKHRVERWTEETTGTREYVTNGAFIEAADRLGYVWKPDFKGSPNAIFKMKVLDKPKKGDGPVVYLIKCGPYYKIGVTQNVEKRAKQLGTLPPFEIEILHTIKVDNVYHLESKLHKRFSDRRMKGEWFKFQDSDVDYIMCL